MTLNAKNVRKDMPSQSVIREYWGEWLVEIGKFDSLIEVHEDDYCFACGMLWVSKGKNTERAHILPINMGGDNSPGNLHLLCSPCHKRSEELFGVAYDSWLKNRKNLDPMYESLITSGVMSLGDFINPPAPDSKRWKEIEATADHYKQVKELREGRIGSRG